MSGIQVRGFTEETVLLLNELGKTKLSYHWKAKNKKTALFIYEGVESSSKALGHSSGMEGFWTEVVLRAGGTFCQAKREASSDKCYPGNSLLSSSLHIRSVKMICITSTKVKINFPYHCRLNRVRHTVEWFWLICILSSFLKLKGKTKCDR